MQYVNADRVLLSLSATYSCVSSVFFSVWAAISGCRSLLQSFEDTFFELVTVENPNITVVILTLSIAVPEIQVFPVWAAILLFPVVVRWRNHLWALGQFQNCRWNFDAIYHSSRDTSTSGLGGRNTISGCQSLSQSPYPSLINITIMGLFHFIVSHNKCIWHYLFFFLNFQLLRQTRG